MDPSKADLLKAKISESTHNKTSSIEIYSSSKVNACLGDDWGSLDFTDSHVGEYKVDPIHLKLPKTSFTPATKDDYSSILQDHVNTIGYTIKGDPPPLKELQLHYDPGFNIAWRSCNHVKDQDLILLPSIDIKEMVSGVWVYM